MSECPETPELHIRLFGGVEIRLRGELLPPFPTRKSQSVFACLVLNHGHTVHRDIVCGRFWPELSDRAARKALRTSLWRMRSTLECEGQSRFLHVDGPYLGLEPTKGAWWVDAWVFEAALECLSVPREGTLRKEDVRRLTEAEAVYRGDLVAGSYDDWSLQQQQRFRLSYLSILERLLSHHADRGEWLHAIMVGRRLLRHDPLREHAHRKLMECHLAMGDRASAIRQYRECVHRLSEELDIEPMEETRHLAARMQRSGSPEALQRAGGGFGPSGGDSSPPESVESDNEIRTLALEVDEAIRTLRSLARRLEECARATHEPAPPAAVERSVPSGT